VLPRPLFGAKGSHGGHCARTYGRLCSNASSKEIYVLAMDPGSGEQNRARQCSSVPGTDNSRRPPACRRGGDTRPRFSLRGIAQRPLSCIELCGWTGPRPAHSSRPRRVGGGPTHGLIVTDRTRTGIPLGSALSSYPGQQADDHRIDDNLA